VIAAALATVRSRIAAAITASGRDPASVQLVAVGKTQPSSALREAYAAGQRDFGENYAQELRDKARELADLPGIRWHFIGRLQTNKAKYVAPVAYRVHAIESVPEAEALAARATGPLTVLLAVNVADETSKGGVPSSLALETATRVSAVPGITVGGLMTLPPYSDDPAASAPHFAALAELAARGRAAGLPLDELSMGMSHDLEVAIAAGATWVRVGTAIFGVRS
jgi:pyridoxal phosphate enzyme (YggS family)